MVNNQNLLADFWQNMPQDDKEMFLETGTLQENAEMELLRMDFDITDLEIYVESLDNAGEDITEEQGTQEPEEIAEVEEPTQEVSFETQEVTPQIVEEVKAEVKPKKDNKGKDKGKAKDKGKQVIQQVQQVTQNVTVKVEQPKPEVKKLTLAEKIAEAQKLVSFSEKKEFTEAKMKELHAYMYAVKEGDIFSLKSSDGKYNFTTPNAELVKEVTEVLEKFFKRKIEGFASEINKIQIA